MDEKGDCFEQGEHLAAGFEATDRGDLREVYKDGFKEEEVILIEDKESAIKLSEEERRGLNKLKDYIRTDILSGLFHS